MASYGLSQTMGTRMVMRLSALPLRRKRLGGGVLPCPARADARILILFRRDKAGNLPAVTEALVPMS